MQDPKCDFRGNLVTKGIEVVADSQMDSYLEIHFKCDNCNQKYYFRVTISVWDLDIPIPVESDNTKND